MDRVKLTEKNLKDIAKDAARVLKEGGAVIFPTDTLYALGVDALSERAIEHFFALKKRPLQKPVPVFVKDIESAGELAYIDKKQEEIIKHLWPGPFTFVLEKRKEVSERLSAGTYTIGLRSPDSAFCRELLNQFGGPVTASSANISGIDPSLDIEDIVAQFKQYSQFPELIIGAGVLPASEPSTVIDITGEEPKILRLNEKTESKLKKIFGADIKF